MEEEYEVVKMFSGDGTPHVCGCGGEYFGVCPACEDVKEFGHVRMGEEFWGSKEETNEESESNGK